MLSLGMATLTLESAASVMCVIHKQPTRIKNIANLNCIEVMDHLHRGNFKDESQLPPARSEFFSYSSRTEFNAFFASSSQTASAFSGSRLDEITSCRRHDDN